MAGQLEPQDPQALLQDVEPILQGIVRRKLHVTLDPGDGRQENQDALELLGDLRVELLQRLVPSAQEKESHGIRDFRGLAATMSYHACAEYFRRKYPQRTRVKNSLRYFLTHMPAYAIWEAKDEELVCGFAHWRLQPLAFVDDATVSRLRETPESFVGPRVSGQRLEQMHRNDWQALLDAIFNALPAPLTLDDLVSIVSRLLHVQDENPAPFSPNPLPRPSSWTETRDTLRRLWQAILQLRPRCRVAYLLNPSGGELDVFPWHGIASIPDIGKALGLTEEHYAMLWTALPLDAAARHQAEGLRTPDEKFAMLWNFIPLEDRLIAQLLGASRQQVINLRRLARDSLMQQLQAVR
jgi:hypothetical protein